MMTDRKKNNAEKNTVGIDPEIKFGLRMLGEIDERFSIEMPAGYGPLSRSHHYREYIDKAVSAFVTYSQNLKRSRCYFTSPFLVRYVLHGNDGSCLYLSKPQMMIAGVLPPCVEAYGMTENNTQTLYGHYVGAGYFSLMMRVDSLPDRYKRLLKSIDIYVSPQIQSFSEGIGFLGSYHDVLCSIGSGRWLGERRIRDNSISMFSGFYSDDGISFTRHYSDPRFAGYGVWHLEPNNDIEEMLVTEHRFYHITSINIDSINIGGSFVNVPVSSTETTHIMGCEVLDEEKIIQHACSTLSCHILPSLPSPFSRLLISISVISDFTDITILQAIYFPRQLILALASGLSPP